MARHWGGDGISEFLAQDESLVMRFGNYFLTNKRLGHYRTLSSTFEFVPLGEFDVRKGHGKMIEGVLLTIMMIFLISAILTFLLYKNSQQTLLLIFTGAFQFYFGYTVLNRFYKDAYIVIQRNKRRKLIIRSFKLEQGLSFALEVVKANNERKSMG